MSHRRCILLGCKPEETSNFFQLPRDRDQRQQWIHFISSWQEWKDTLSEQNTHICSQHFLESDYANAAQFKMGFASRLRLRFMAVPSVYPGQAARTTQDVACLSSPLSDASDTFDHGNEDTAFEEPFQILLSMFRTRNLPSHHQSSVQVERSHRTMADAATQCSQDLVTSIDASTNTAQDTRTIGVQHFYRFYIG